MQKMLGEGTVVFAQPVYVRSYAAAVGKDEAEGPLGAYFDIKAADALWDQGTFEQAEKRFFMEAAKMALSKAGLSNNDIDFLVAGDLLNQIISASFSARDLGIPYVGLYGACSCMSESLSVASMLIDGGFANEILCVTSSHFATAERQFRNPLELGTPKPPTAQDTVTGAGATVLCKEQQDICITAATIGKVVDLGITDAGNMGGAMAPSAVQTVLTHLEKMGTTPQDYDAVYTGDLGVFGSELFLDLTKQYGFDFSANYRDCGAMIYAGNKNKPNGASGCGCSATVLNGYILQQMQAGTLHRVLFVATGSLQSPTSVLQGESIPGVAHAVELTRRQE